MGNNFNILIIQNDPVISETTRRVLEQAGYETICAPDGETALLLASQHKPNLALLDVDLPGIDGFEVCRRIKADPSLSSIYIVMMSGMRQDSDSTAEALELGAEVYLTLPITNRELLARIEAILHVRAAEIALRESEDLFKYVFDHSVTGKSITLPTGEMNVNQAFGEMLGYSQEELKNRKWLEITHPEDIALTQEAVDSLLSGQKETVRFVKRYLHKNGSIVWADVGVALRRDQDAHPLYFITSITNITQRKQTEAALRTLSSRQEAILAAVPDILMEVDKDKVYTWANPAGLEFFGTDVIGKEAAFYFEGEQDTYSQVRPLFNGGENVIYLESWQRRKDGEKRLLAWWCRVLKDSNKNVIGALSSAHDITEPRQAEKLQDAIYRIAQAADHAESLDSLYPSIHAIIQEVMVADNFYIALMDEKNDLLSFPYSVDEVEPPSAPQKPGRGLTEYVLRTAKSLLCNDELFEELKLSGETELVGVNSLIWLGVPLMIGDKVIGVMAVQDYKNACAYGEREQRILEFVSSQAAMAIHRKQTEQALLESEDRYRRLVESLPDGVIVHSQGRIVFANLVIAKIGGVSSPAELIGKPVIEFVHPDYREAALKRIQESLRDGVPAPLAEEKFIKADGTVIEVEVTAIPFSYAGKPAVLTVVNDISERKRAEEALKDYNTRLEAEVTERAQQLRDAQERLIRQEKLAVLGQLAGGVGHELRNPLSVILNAIYFLKLVHPEADEQTKEYFGIIEQETRSAEKIITDLLDFARIKSVDREVVAASELVQRVMKRYPAPLSVSVTLDIPSDQPPIFADARQMEQVLGNLVLNAYQAMPEGGRLVISALKQKDEIALSVADTGVGIPPENLDKLFEPLFTPKAKGIGLGLAVCKKLVEANSGRIEVQSEAGKGSTFTVYLPA